MTLIMTLIMTFDLLSEKLKQDPLMLYRKKNESYFAGVVY